MAVTWKFLKRYGLGRGEIKSIDLRTTYHQCTPARPMDEFFCNTGSMMDSPHLEFAQLYFKNGHSWMKKHYKKTRLHSLRKKLGKKRLPVGMILLCDSIQRGYLHGKHSDDHIIILDVPFCNSRYNLREHIKSPEVFAGHHRIGALLALKKFIVPVLFGVDESPGSCFSLGKIHAACGGSNEII